MIEKEDDSILASKRSEDSVDLALRPTTLDELIGQQGVKDNLLIQIQAAKQRGEALEHVLFHGPPGLGKTPCAYLCIGNGCEHQIYIRTSHRAGG